jgi:hypothetical protein
LTLVVDDPELVVELTNYAEGSMRNSFAVSALRIGVLALRQARGNVDADTLRREGDHLLSELKQELQSRVTEIDTRVASTLKRYFDPESGHFTERVERLVKKDGDLERVLRDQIGDAESSELARALARRIGESSPLMRRLNPEDAESIIKSIESSVKEVLEGEQTNILSEFSLDNPNGALTRVVNQLEEKNGEFKGDIEKQIKQAVKEFSLDDESSALSRLVKKVQDANDQIAEEFSKDNEQSAINKLNSVLAETKNSIMENLTLDNEQSALARLRKQLTSVLDDIRTKNEQFQQDVRTTLATLITKRQEAQRSTTHGNDFEQEFCEYVRKEVQKTGDIFTATGGKVGALPKCKKGDGVIEIGPESTAAGEMIVLEAKDDKSYSLEDARIFVIWDASDPLTDVYLSAAVSVAKALVFREKFAEKKSNGDLNRIEMSINMIEKHLKTLDEVEKWTATIKANSGKVLKAITNLRDGAAERIEELRKCVTALKSTITVQ